MKKTFTIGAFAIILDEEKKVLLCHRRDYDLWNLPGGGVEAGEAPWECAVREVKEEVGLDVEIDYLAGIYSKNNSDIVFSFVCKIVGGKIKKTSEADKIEYFSLKDIPKNTSPKQVERINDALNQKNKKLIMKTQIGPSSIDLVKQGKL
ncbi:MAG: NUDIX hydrolase [Candidatus Moraniibacteriota bacterium]